MQHLTLLVEPREFSGLWQVAFHVGDSAIDVSCHEVPYYCGRYEKPFGGEIVPVLESDSAIAQPYPSSFTVSSS